MAATFYVLRSNCLSSAKDALLRSVAVRTPMVNQSKGLALSAFRRANVRSPTLKERLLAPEQGTAFTLGKVALLGASAFGIGSLCYYGLRLSSQPGAIDKSVMWPQHVKDRIKSTYAYLGGSVVIAAASAAAVYQSPRLLNLMMKNSWLTVGATYAAMIGSGVVAHSIPYTEGFGAVQIAWVVLSGIMGAGSAHLCFIGGPLLLRALCYTGGMLGSFSTVAACAPSEKFLNIGGPLACGLGVVFASSLASMFLSPATALGAGLYSISMYGILGCFSGVFLGDSQVIIYMAKTDPSYAVQPYDLITTSIQL